MSHHRRHRGGEGEIVGAPAAMPGALFEGPTHLPSMQGGADNIAAIETPPDAGFTGSVRAGTGSFSGDITFTLRTEPRYWIPAQTYFRLRTHFTPGSAGTAQAPLLSTCGLALAENLIPTHFATVRAYLDGAMVEECLRAP